MAIYTAAVSNAYMSIYTASGPHKKYKNGKKTATFYIAQLAI